MIDQPSASGEEQKSDKTPTAENPTKAAAAKNNEDATGENSKRTKYIMWSIKALHACVDFFDRHHGAVTAIATIVIAILTYFYVHYSRAQWTVMSRALDTNERAWVLVQAQGFALRPQPFAENPQGYPLLNGVMVNSGKSPAFRVVYVARVSFELARPDIPSEDSGEWTEGSGLDLAPGGGPGGTSLLYAGFGPVGFPPEKYAAVERGDLPLFMWVFVRYSDPFSNDRFTQKCIRYMPKTAKPGIGVGGAALSGLILCPSRYQIHR